MRIRHTVVFRLLHEPDSVQEERFLNAARTTLAQIDGVRDFKVSRQISEKSQFRWQFSMTFDGQQAYDFYNAHPAHIAFVMTRWDPEVRDFQEYDFIEP